MENVAARLFEMMSVEEVDEVLGNNGEEIINYPERDKESVCGTDDFREHNGWMPGE